MALVLSAVYAEYRDRPSLKWPKVSGTVMRCDELVHYHRGAHYSVAVTYTYVVKERRYVGDTIARWSPNWGDGRPTGPFVAAHPVHSAVDVYYEPQRPENAVLVPGPDEVRNRISIWGGSAAFVGGVVWAFMLRAEVAEVKARVPKLAKAEGTPEQE
jgi:hypothetical protein